MTSGSERLPVTPHTHCGFIHFNFYVASKLDGCLHIQWPGQVPGDLLVRLPPRPLPFFSSLKSPRDVSTPEPSPIGELLLKEISSSRSNGWGPKKCSFFFLLCLHSFWHRRTLSGELVLCLAYGRGETNDSRYGQPYNILFSLKCWTNFVVIYKASMGGQTMILASLFLLPLPPCRAVSNWCFVFYVYNFFPLKFFFFSSGPVLIHRSPSLFPHYSLLLLLP